PRALRRVPLSVELRSRVPSRRAQPWRAYGVRPRLVAYPLSGRDSRRGARALGCALPADRSPYRRARARRIRGLRSHLRAVEIRLALVCRKRGARAQAAVEPLRRGPGSLQTGPERGRYFPRALRGRAEPPQ